MTLKDWKKTEETSASIEYQNKKNLQRIVIYIYGLIPKKQEFDVEIESVGRKSGFKTKSQALAYARQYMRNN